MTTPVRVKTPGELAGTIPYLLGFTPDEGSLVYVTVGQGPFARLDMTDDVADAIAMLSPMWDQYPPTSAALVFYSSDPRKVLDHAMAINLEMQYRGGNAPTALRVHDGICEYVNGDGTQYLVDETPPAAAPFVTEGRAPMASREALAARVSTDEDHIQEGPFEAALEALKAEGKPAFYRAAEDVLAAMHQYLEDGTLPTDEVIPTFALALQHKPVRDLAWYQLRRDNGAQYAEFFLHLYRRCPALMTAPIASMLAFAAWLDGGLSPLAWAGAEKAIEVEPTYTMAHLVLRALHGAVSPEVYTSPSAEVVDAIWEVLR
jgi:hypothetical protein